MNKPREERKGYECIHAEDNGRLVLVKFPDGIEIVCQKCNSCWKLDLPYEIGMTEDFKTTKELK